MLVAAIGFALVALAGCGERYTVDSTAYCVHGTTASGAYTSDGTVAMNTFPGTNRQVPFGTQFRIESGTLKGKVVTVQDRYGYGTQFDIWLSTCTAAINYGRQTIQITQLN